MVQMEMSMVPHAHAFFPPIVTPKTNPLTPNMPHQRAVPKRISHLTPFEATVCRQLLPDTSKFKSACDIKAHFKPRNLKELHPGYFNGPPAHRRYMRKLTKKAEEVTLRIFKNRCMLSPVTGMLKAKISKVMTGMNMGPAVMVSEEKEPSKPPKKPIMERAVCKSCGKGFHAPRSNYCRHCRI